MSLLTRLADLFFSEPARLDDTNVTVELRQVSQSALIDLTNRKHNAIRLIDAKLRDERSQSPRNVDRVNDLLEIRAALEPGSRLLPVRRSTPVNPGRWS